MGWFTAASFHRRLRVRIGNLLTLSELLAWFPALLLMAFAEAPRL